MTATVEVKNPEEIFTENAFYERLLAMQKQGKLKLSLLSVPTRLALGYYSAAKRQAESLKAE